MKVGGTNAFYYDEELSEGNILALGTLDMELVVGEDELQEAEDAENMLPEDIVIRTATATNIGTLPFQYNVKFQKKSGSDDLCGSLLLTALKNGTAVYENLSLSSFDLDILPPLTSGDGDNWHFAIELPADAGSDLEDLDCNFDFVFTSWQTDFVAPTCGWTDEEIADNNNIHTGDWSVDFGDVVINEIMWMGSDEKSSDEWIELRNMTDRDIEIGKWTIENTKKGPVSYMIPANNTISANRFFLIASYPENSANTALSVDPNVHSAGLFLKDEDNGNLVLKTDEDVVIDEAKGDEWPDGKDGPPSWQSMERENVPGDGTDAGNWYTCDSPEANGDNFWDVEPGEEGKNFGTPGTANLHPVVMNEIMVNPKEGDEWVELYNIAGEDWDAEGWYFENDNEERLFISEDNTDSEETVVPGEGFLIVYNNRAESFLNNDGDQIKFYDNAGTPDDYSDDILVDEFEYDGEVPENKTFVRLPDGLGPWIDPDPTPGEENVINDEEVKYYREIVFDKCFDERTFDKEEDYHLCKAVFLEYLGILDDVDDKKMPKDVFEELSGKDSEKDKNEKESDSFEQDEQEMKEVDDIDVVKEDEGKNDESSNEDAKLEEEDDEEDDELDDKEDDEAKLEDEDDDEAKLEEEDGEDKDEDEDDEDVKFEEEDEEDEEDENKTEDNKQVKSIDSAIPPAL